MHRVLLVALLLVTACKRQDDPARSQPSPVGSAAPVQAQTHSEAADPCAKARPHGALAWFEDDLESATRCAQRRGVPVVLDLWAPWCHTCLSMQSTVFTDKSFAADASRFVFAALDTDREVNAAAVARYPLSAWPTFYVIGLDGAVLARFIGAASVTQFHAFLDAGARAMAGGAAGADARLLAAERALTGKDLEAADRELTAALAAAPPEWARRPDALVSLIGAKARRKDAAGCVELAETAMDSTGNAASASDFLVHAMGCADELASDKAQAARVTRLRERAVARWQQLVGDASAPMSVDDRSDAMANLRETLDELGRKAEARKVAESQRALLDDAAAKAGDPMAAMTYNWPRAEVYVYLQRPLDLVPALEKSAADLPKEYDPRARLGWVLWKGGKLVEAAKWTDEAVRLVYGPRKARVLSLRADIARDQGDKAAERKARQDIVALWQSLPPGHAQPEALAKARQSLEDLDKPPVAAH